MTKGTNDHLHKRKAHQLAKKSGGGLTGIFNGIVGYIDSLSQHLPGFLQGPFKVWVKGVTLLPDLVTHEWSWLYDLARRLYSWITTTVPKIIRRELQRGLAQLRRWTWAQIRYDRRLIWRVHYLDVTYALNLFAHERRWREHADAKNRAAAWRWVRALHQQIEREAVSGYRNSKAQRLDLIQRVADLIVTNDPVVKRLVKDLVSGILDLASVDDPLARIALGFVLKQVIDRLGIDKPIGDLLRSLLAPLLGAPKPHDLPSVIADICLRLNSLEGNWADFMAAGGPEVEQAGREWKQLAGIVTDAGILAFWGLAATEPDNWARAVTDTLGVVLGDTLTSAVDLIMKG